MSIREDIERMECETLSPYATLSILRSVYIQEDVMIRKNSVI